MTKEPFKIPKPKSVLKSKDLISPKVGRPEKMSDRAADGNWNQRKKVSVTHATAKPTQASEEVEVVHVARGHVPTPEQTQPFSRACSAEDQTTKHNYGTITSLN